MADTPTFNVIPGGWIASPDWLDFPQAVVGQSPFDEGQAVAYRVSRDDTIKAASQRRRQPALDFWSMIAGKVPPLPSLVGSNEGLYSLADAHACFQGLKRPLADDHLGDNSVAFVLKPKHFYVFDVARRELATRERVPHDLVFMVYARLDQPFELKPTVGVLTHWQFAEADDGTGMLPVNSSERYAKRLW